MKMKQCLEDIKYKFISTWFTSFFNLKNHYASNLANQLLASTIFHSSDIKLNLCFQTFHLLTFVFSVDYKTKQIIYLGI